jgi:hypothetical protein
MNKKTLITILILAVVIVGLLFIRRSQTPQSSQTNTSNSTTATSSLYSNGTYGISFRYPDKYDRDEKDINDAQGKRHVITLVTKADKELLSQIEGPTDGPTAITVTIVEKAAAKQSLSQWVRTSNLSNFKLAPSHSYASSSVNSLEAVAYSWDGLYQANTIVFPYRENIVMLTMTYITNQDAIWKDFASVIQSLKLN